MVSKVTIEGHEGVAMVTLSLCEQGLITLRPDTLYVFRTDTNCPKCMEIANSYKGMEGEGKLPVSVSPSTGR